MKLEKAPSLVKETSPTQKFEILLGLFGTDKAREVFISLCKEYDKERAQHVVLSGDGENYRHGRKKVAYSPPLRAHLHNKIMDIISKLASQSKKLNPEQESVLRHFHSRENVAEAIHKYVTEDRNYMSEEDEMEEQVKKGKDQSEVAYYHSLGKEH